MKWTYQTNTSADGHWEMIVGIPPRPVPVSKSDLIPLYGVLVLLAVAVFYLLLARIRDRRASKRLHAGLTSAEEWSHLQGTEWPPRYRGSK